MRLAKIENGIVTNVIEVDVAGIPKWCKDWPEAQAAGPGWRWDGSKFTPPPPQDPVLTHQQWRYLLDLTGFGDTLDAVLARMPKGTAAERKAWAGLKTVATASGSYRLDRMLAMVAFVAAKKLPGVTLPSEAAIRAAWAEAAAFTGEIGV